MSSVLLLKGLNVCVDISDYYWSHMSHYQRGISCLTWNLYKDSRKVSSQFKIGSKVLSVVQRLISETYNTYDISDIVQ